MEKKPLHEIMAEMLGGSKLTEADNVVGKTNTTIKVDKDVKDPNQEAIDTANIIKSAPTREDPNKDTSEVEDDVDGIADGILVITDPEITSEEFDEVADELQGIVDKSEGELPFTDKYKGDYILSCPICGGTFVNDTLLDSGEDVCPICCKVPDAFVVSGKIEDAGNAVEKEEVQDDIEQEENVEQPEEMEDTEAPMPTPDKGGDDLELEGEEEPNKKESKSLSGNKLQEKLEEGKDMEEINAGNIKKKAMEILPKEDIDVHDGDLYLKVSDKSTELVNQMKDKDSGLLSKFRSHIDNEMWYEIPFANMEDDYKEKVQEADEQYIYDNAQPEGEIEGISAFDLAKKMWEVAPESLKSPSGDAAMYKAIADVLKRQYYGFRLPTDKKTEAVDDNGNLTNFIKVPDENDYVGSVWENNKAYKFNVYKVGDKYVDGNGYEVEQDKVNQLEKKTEDYGEDDTRNKEVINPEDKDYYDGKLWQVRVWCGNGYVLNYFNMYHDGKDTEDMLCKVVAYAEDNEPEILLKVDDIIEEVNTTWKEEYEEWSEENNNESDEYQFAMDYLDLVYVDATAEGASQPYFIRGENLAILDFDMNESKVEESVNSEVVSKAKQLGKEAFENGMKRVPAQDKELVYLLDTLAQGEGSEVLSAWLDAWDKANIEAPVEESKKVEKKEIKTESKMVWTSDEEIDEEGFWEWLEDNQYLDDQIQARVNEIEEQTGYEATEEDIEQIRNELAEPYREDYYNMLNEQLLEDWEDNIKPMLENQLDETDTLICMGTAQTWRGSGSAYRICDGISELENIMAEYDSLELTEEESGLCMKFAHHDGTHVMGLYTLASTPEMIFETLYDKQSPIVTGYEDFDDYLSEHYEEDIVEDLLDNAQDNQEVLEKVLKPLVNLI